MANLLYEFDINGRRVNHNRDCLAGCAVRWGSDDKVEITNFKWFKAGTVPGAYAHTITQKVDQLAGHIVSSKLINKDDLIDKGDHFIVNTDMPSALFFTVLKVLRLPVKNYTVFCNPVSPLHYDVFSPYTQTYWGFNYPFNIIIMDAIMKGATIKLAETVDAKATEPYATRGEYGTVFDPISTIFHSKLPDSLFGETHVNSEVQRLIAELRTLYYVKYAYRQLLQCSNEMVAALLGNLDQNPFVKYIDGVVSARKGKKSV